MSSQQTSRLQVCEQCGAPLLSLAGEQGCLNCLLRAGINYEIAEESISPKKATAPLYEHYEILSRPDGSLWELGRDATSVTYKARHVSLEISVALKVINRRVSLRPEARERFLSEARLAAQLRHPNMISVFHFGIIDDSTALHEIHPEKHPEGDCFYVMEFIDGESLEARVRRKGPLDPVLAFDVAVQVARALSAAEKRGLLHCNLKPANIMLLAGEETSPEHVSLGHSSAWVKVVDFELGGLRDERNKASVVSQSFNEPALCNPVPDQTLPNDNRSDLYSLGLVLWFALTGESFPFRGQSATFSRKWKRALTPSVRRLLDSLLAYDSKDRPCSALELTRTLERYLERLANPERSGRNRLRRVTLAAAFSVAAALLGLATYLFWSPDPSLNKSIVVLPFRNLTSDSENAFFAEGVQDDILSRLAKIRDLKVVGRRGAPPIAIGPTTDLRKIGRSLGVRHVLEGSLRRYGDQVMLHVSLIDSSDGREIWSESYDRKLEDAISLQGELASNIADALKAQLTPQERTNVRAPSTHNPDAYVLYLRGRKLENSPTFQIKNYEAAQSLFGQAVALDRKFALAHASLASALGLLYRYRAPSDDLRERAYLEVEEALRLQPDLGEAHLAKGLTDYRVARNFEAAMAEFKVASRLLPNESEPELMTALIQRREGRWREARIGLEHAIARNPLDRKCEEELAATACLLRDWPRAVRHLDKAVAIRPIIQPLRIERVILDVWKRGDLQPLQDELQTVQSFADPEGALTWVRWDAAMLSRDFAKAEGLLLIYPLDTLPSVVGVPIPKSYFQGCVALAAGKYDQARQFLEAARPAMEAEAVAHPNDAMRHARLGLLYAYLGRRNEALREGEKAVELVPVSADAIDGHHWLCNLALIHARVGDISKAIAMIESLLRQPGCVSPLNEASLTLWDLRLRWQWDPLRKDPRFQKILASTEPKTVF